jgi:hypothetical protein
MVKDLREVQEVRGAIQMLNAIERLPVHVEDKLEDFKVEEQRLKEKEDAERRRRSTI